MGCVGGADPNGPTDLPQEAYHIFNQILTFIFHTIQYIGIVVHFRPPLGGRPETRDRFTEVLTIVGHLSSFLTLTSGILDAVRSGHKIQASQRLKEICGTPDFSALPEELAPVADQVEGYLFTQKTGMLGEYLFSPGERAEFIDGFFQKHPDALPCRSEVEAILSDYINRLESYLPGQLSVGETALYCYAASAKHYSRRKMLAIAHFFETTGTIENAVLDLCNCVERYIDLDAIFSQPVNLTYPERVYSGGTLKNCEIFRDIVMRYADEARYPEHVKLIEKTDGVTLPEQTPRIDHEKRDRAREQAYFDLLFDKAGAVHKIILRDHLQYCTGCCCEDIRDAAVEAAQTDETARAAAIEYLDQVFGPTEAISTLRDPKLLPLLERLMEIALSPDFQDRAFCSLRTGLIHALTACGEEEPEKVMEILRSHRGIRENHEYSFQFCSYTIDVLTQKMRAKRDTPWKMRDVKRALETVSQM